MESDIRFMREALKVAIERRRGPRSVADRLRYRHGEIVAAERNHVARHLTP
ncbi:hypothetical protein [Tardiphaga sp.]|uniref:hypothetical protein n=1 Tax=Tardiphaga sp. TaxID=1926292 RepID=UPI00262049B7|nr:hypothetical protein [Tardiphaga sp.]